MLCFKRQIKQTESWASETNAESPTQVKSLWPWEPPRAANYSGTRRHTPPAASHLCGRVFDLFLSSQTRENRNPQRNPKRTGPPIPSLPQVLLPVGRTTTRSGPPDQGPQPRSPPGVRTSLRSALGWGVGSVRLHLGGNPSNGRIWASKSSAPTPPTTFFIALSFSRNRFFLQEARKANSCSDRKNCANWATRLITMSIKSL